MEVKYCVIAKPAGSDKFITVNHEPRTLTDASRIANLSPGNHTSVMLVRFEKVEETIDRLNTYGVKGGEMPRLPYREGSRPNVDPQEYLESAISIAITACKREMLERGLILNVKEIYVGAESNEVQVTIETKQADDRRENANDTDKSQQ